MSRHLPVPTCAPSEKLGITLLLLDIACTAMHSRVKSSGSYETIKREVFMLELSTTVLTSLLMRALSALLLSLIVATAVQADFILQDWTLQATTIAPDGVPRIAALVNGVYPGPLLKANKGDTLMVLVHNQLSDSNMRQSTSIHWHGIFQPRNAFNDGPSFVTQCPIARNHTYPYQLVLGDQAGTFWYHSHLSTQYVDGIRGPLVIYDPNDPHKSLYDVDDETTIITLSDWYHTPALISTNQWLKENGSEPAPDSGLINGAGRYKAGGNVPYARINVTQGKRYRFRLISLSATGSFNFYIPGHPLTIIEADGISHTPYTVDSVQMLPGQRYSVIVNANQTVGNYWIHAPQSVFAAAPDFNGTEMYAVLHYAGAPDAEPTVPQPSAPAPGFVPFNETNLKPLDPGPPGGTGPADYVLDFNYTVVPGGNGRWMVNGHQYQPPSVPTLLKVLTGATNESDFNITENTRTLPSNSTIEIAFSGGGGHAFHLHGHAFDVIQSAGQLQPNLIDPPRRDVVASGAGLRIRFRTDNSGPWFLHCHLDFHLEAGLAAVFVEDPNGIRGGPQSIQPSSQWNELCDIYDSLTEDQK